jgi:membrane protein
LSEPETTGVAVRGSRPPGAPFSLSLREWRDAFEQAGRGFVADGCMNLAQQVSYSSILAFFPAIAFLLGLLGVLNLYDQLQSFLAEVAPHGVISFVQGLQHDSTGSAGVTALVLGGAGAIWAASGAMGSVIQAVNTAYETGETRPFWKKRILAIVLVVLAGTTILALAVLIVFGGPIGQAIADKAHVGSAFTVVWSIARWPVAFVAILLLFALIYSLAPDQRPRTWRWVSPGSVVGALLWLILSALFALYATFAGSYSRTYGSLAAGVILLLWLNYTAWAILFGAELNAALEKQADVRAAGGKSAGLVRRVRRR